MNTYAQRIEDLRAFMRSREIDAVVIYGSDPHISEYPSLRWKQVEWLTGFTGEAADLVVTQQHAGLWTDSRYFIQANSQLQGTGVVLHKTRVPGEVNIVDWLKENTDSQAAVAIDSLCTSVEAYKNLRNSFQVVCIPDLLNAFWADRPEVVQTPVFTINPGESREEKIEWLREIMRSRGCDYFLIASLDEIAWCLNVRASDVEYNPFVISYLLVGQEDVKWFVLKDTVEDDVTENTFDMLSNEGIQICRYDEVSIEVQSLSEGRLWVDENAVNAELYSSIRCGIYGEPSPVQRRKAIKNTLEIENTKEAHVRDGVAMEEFLYWLEKSIERGDVISEWDAAVKQREFRSRVEDYQGESFETISAYGPGAALPHYHTPNHNAPRLYAQGLYLNDSGGQYLSGTTDITRTIPLGECSELEKRDYTLVLKAHINLAAAVFPKGTPGCRVDAAARLPLWRNLLNFGHGTGHGVGYFLVRILGKYVGAWLGCAAVGKEKRTRNYLGLALIPQAGVAIGLAALGARTLGGVMGNDLETIILASSILYELLGPGCAKLALYLSGSYSTRLEDVAVVPETTETGEKKTDVELLIERIQKIRSELPPVKHEEMSEEEAAFLEAAEEQRLAQTQAQRRSRFLRR